MMVVRDFVVHKVFGFHLVGAGFGGYSLTSSIALLNLASLFNARSKRFSSSVILCVIVAI